MKRKFFTIFSALSLLLCSAALACWIFSYGSGFGAATGSTTGASSLRQWQLFVYHGRVAGLFIAWTTSGARPSNDGPRQWQYGRLHEKPDLDQPGVHFGFGYLRETATIFSQIYIARALLFPCWAAVVATSVLPLWKLGHVLQRQSRVRGSRCVTCGYDLRVTPERCPECGMAAKAAP